MILVSGWEAPARCTEREREMESREPVPARSVIPSLRAGLPPSLTSLSSSSLPLGEAGSRVAAPAPLTARPSSLEDPPPHPRPTSRPIKVQDVCTLRQSAKIHQVTNSRGAVGGVHTSLLHRSQVSWIPEPALSPVSSLHMLANFNPEID